MSRENRNRVYIFMYILNSENFEKTKKKRQKKTFRYQYVDQQWNLVKVLCKGLWLSIFDSKVC